MSSDDLGSDFNAYYSSRASRTERLVAATCRAATKPRRDPTAQFWRPRLVTATEQQTKRNEKTDSKLFDSALHVAPRTETSHTRDPSLLSALPATIRAGIYESALAKNEPIEFTYHFRSLHFEFDLRTEHGLSEFTAWRHALGSHAWGVRSLTLRHWTSWWGFGVNSWTSSEDKTHFSRRTSGEIVISQALPTPAHETCKRSVEHLLVQQDAAFDLESFRAVTAVLQFVNCLRTIPQGADRPTLVDAAKIFAELLQEHSRNLAKRHGLAGDECVKCNMPSLYLCGHLSAREEKNGSDVVFDARATSKPSRTSVRLSTSR